MKASKMIASKKSVFKCLTISFFCFSLSACSLAPRYEQPPLDLPMTWYNEGNEKNANTKLERQWWKRFNDPALDLVIETTLKHNYDLKIAAEQIEQARAALGIATSGLLPSINAQGGATYTEQALQLTTNPPYTLNLAASWELDFWGKYRNARSQAKEQLLATEFGKQALLLEIVAQAATAYFTLLSLDEQLDVSLQTLKTREEAFRIYSERYKEGLISELDYLRAGTEVDTTRTTIFTLEYQISNAVTALQVLMGKSPRALFEESIELDYALSELPVVPQLPEGVPSELLMRRPDIQAAEASLKAANFEIGIAKSAWFPAISLTGSLGMTSQELGDLFANPIWFSGGKVLAPLFSGGKILNNVRVTEAKQREAVLQYQKAVQLAFQDVKTALSVQETIGDVVHSLEASVEALATSVDLAELRYNNGYTSYLDLLDAQRSLFATQIQLAEARSQHLSTIVSICRALGGGWIVTESKEK